jgi:uncharacterized protein
MREKLTRLKELATGLTPGLIAVSGGLDSRVLARQLWEWDLDIQPLHFVGAHVPEFETAFARSWISRQGRKVHIVEVEPLTLAPVATNQPLRCYHCKRHMFTRALDLARELGLPHVLDGTQASDQKLYRPGVQALEELGVASPLARAGITKPEIRQLAAGLGMELPDQPARPCLLTRFDYDYEIDPGMLPGLARTENRLARAGLAEFRLRLKHKSRPVLQIEESESGKWPDIRELCTDILRQGGFWPAQIVWSETVSGYFDNPHPGSRPGRS